MRVTTPCLVPMFALRLLGIMKEGIVTDLPKSACSSFDYGLVHTVILNNYIEFTVNTPQYKWCADRRPTHTCTQRFICNCSLKPALALAFRDG